jgi:hypothetical protein
MVDVAVGFCNDYVPADGPRDVSQLNIVLTEGGGTNGSVAYLAHDLVDEHRLLEPRFRPEPLAADARSWPDHQPQLAEFGSGDDRLGPVGRFQRRVSSLPPLLTAPVETYV